MAYGWEGEKVRLVPIDAERMLDNYIQWLNDPEVTEWLLIGDHPLGRLNERDFLEKAERGSETDIVFAIETLEGRHIGTSGIHRIDYRHGGATTGSFIGEKEMWGKGYGTDAARIRARYCFEVLGLRQLRSSTLEGNDRSFRMQAAVGAEMVGRWPGKYWKRGAWRDEILMCLTRDRWESAAQAGGR